MVRIILEDIKINKDKKIIKPQEIVATPISANINNIYKEEVKTKGEFDVDTYINSRTSHTPRLPRTPQVARKSRFFSKPILLLFIFSLLAGTIYWGGNYFQKAIVTITSKKQAINYDHKSFTASKILNSGGVDFEIMIISDSFSKNIILTEPKEVSIKAHGSITLYNEFGTTPQKITAGSFVSDENGKVYKTDETITIPGFKTVDKKIIPGQIEVNISSFLPGEAYNGEPIDFHISAFKGTSKYSKIYGKLKSPLVGGAQGLVYSVSDKDKENIDNVAQNSFKSKLLDNVKSQVPPGYILYPLAMTFSYKIDEETISKTPEAEVKINGDLTVFLLNEKSLVSSIIKNSLPTLSKNELKEVSIVDLNKLVFNFSNKDQLITKELESIPFSLTGDINAIWNPDTEILKSKLAGVDKNDVLSIFRQDPGISSAIVSLFPPWKKTLPVNTNKINIVVQ